MATNAKPNDIMSTNEDHEGDSDLFNNSIAGIIEAFATLRAKADPANTTTHLEGFEGDSDLLDNSLVGIVEAFDTLKAKHEHAQGKIAELQVDLGGMIGEAYVAQEHAADLETKLEVVLDLVAGKEAQCKVLEAEAAKTARERDERADVLETKLKTLQEVMISNGLLCKALVAEAGKMAREKRDYHEAQMHVGVLEAENKALVRRMANKEAAYKVLADKAANMAEKKQEKVDSLEAELEVLQTRLARKETQCEALEDEVAKVSQEKIAFVTIMQKGQTPTAYLFNTESTVECLLEKFTHPLP